MVSITSPTSYNQAKAYSTQTYIQENIKSTPTIWKSTRTDDIVEMNEKTCQPTLMRKSDTKYNMRNSTIENHTIDTVNISNPSNFQKTLDVNSDEIKTLKIQLDDNEKSMQYQVIEEFTLEQEYQIKSKERLSMSELHEEQEMKSRESELQYRMTEGNGTAIHTGKYARDSLMPTQDSPTLRTSMRPSILEQNIESLPALLQAAMSGNIKKMRLYIQDKTTDFNVRDQTHGQNVLHIAVRYGQLPIIQLLCHKRLQHILLNAQDHRKNTPLHLAAAKSRRITKTLLEAGADVTSLNMKGYTPLCVYILTAKQDDPLIAEMLLQFKSDVNITIEGSTLIHKAIDRSLYEIAARLVRHGAGLDVEDKNGLTVFEKVSPSILKKLIGKITSPPVWIADKARKNCMVCTKQFNRLFSSARRHHCRHCGRLCCASCSENYIHSADFPETFNTSGCHWQECQQKALPQRVCTTCHVVLKERKDALKKSSSRSSAGNWKKMMGWGYSWDECHDLGSSRASLGTVRSSRG